jgi:lipopolysaccharide transport system ATP-binding protein
MAAIIEVRGVSKRFSRNANAHLSYGLRDLMDEILGRKKRQALRPDEFWAAREVSFDIEPGASFALVGRNGSGKTTLLKMMNGLIKPDAGEIRLYGAVQALINLGTGFNPNLSGRDNVYNAASIQGLNRRETNAILDEVIAFSELSDVMDSPFQTYSSGMKARLGFAVAVHLRPEILLIDEILSVGDYAFQNKCFVKMQELKQSGTTIVLVSHSHTQVMQLCERAAWIHQGELRDIGPSRDIITSYLSFLDMAEAARAEAEAEKKTEAGHELYGPVHGENPRCSAVQFEILHAGAPQLSVPVHGDVTFRYAFTLADAMHDLNVTLNLYREDGVLAACISTLRGDLLKESPAGRLTAEIRVRDLCLAPGNYVAVLPIHEGHSYLYRNVVAKFRVTGGGEMFWGLCDLSYEYTHPGGVFANGARG